MISDVREKGSLIEVYDANSKRISYMSAGNKELVGVFLCSCQRFIN